VGCNSAGHGGTSRDGLILPRPDQDFVCDPHERVNSRAPQLIGDTLGDLAFDVVVSALPCGIIRPFDRVGFRESLGDCAGVI
jgi:hypothetical protein